MILYTEKWNYGRITHFPNCDLRAVKITRCYGRLAMYKLWYDTDETESGWQWFITRKVLHQGGLKMMKKRLTEKEALKHWNKI